MVPRTALAQSIRLELDEYRKFRHHIRNIYAPHLDALKMNPLLDSLPHTWQQVQIQLRAFADFLENLEK